MVEKLRGGVAGAGVFGGYHATKYTEVSGASLAAVFDVDQGRATDAASQRGADAFSDFDAFLDAVDLVTIAAPASYHADLAMRALKSGTHVLVEKPIALDLEAADLLIAEANSRQLILQVGHQERYVADAFGLLDAWSTSDRCL